MTISIMEWTSRAASVKMQFGRLNIAARAKLKRTDISDLCKI